MHPSGHTIFKLSKVQRAKAGTIESHTPSTEIVGNIMNLSSVSISASEGEVLGKGLKFIPAPQKVEREPIVQAAVRVVRKAKLAYFFRHRKSKQRLPFEIKSQWTPEDNHFPEELLKGLDKIIETAENIELSEPKSNISKDQRNTLKRLMRNKQIVIKPADKGSAIVVQDRCSYIWEAKRQLGNTKNYIKLKEPMYPTTADWYADILYDLHDKGFLTDKQLLYLFPPSEPRPRRFYLLPKIHKEPAKWSKPHLIPPGRPVISDCSSESYAIAEYIDYWLQPLATSHPAYLKDTNDVLSKINEMVIPGDALIVTADVDAMYTNIEHEQGLAAIRQALKDHPDPSRPPDEVLLKLLDWGLSRNDFEFDGEFYLQTCGTAMGKKFSPSYANIFMAQWEKRVLSQAQLKPLIYKRFLDDIFMIWTHGREALDNFLTYLNADNPCITLKAEISEKSVDFLDLTIFKGPRFSREGILDTKVYHKPTDTMQLLHKESFHPKHTFSGIIKSQVIRYDRLSTNKADFEHSCRQLFEALAPRGYSRRFLGKIKGDTLSELEAKRAGTPRRPATTPPIPSISHGSSKPCGGSRCRLCLAIKSTDRFRSSVTHREYTISDHLTCTSSKVVYLIQCKQCGIQYVGQTGRSLRQRFWKYFSDIDSWADNLVADHFNLCGSIANLEVIPIAQVPLESEPEATNTLLDLETHWIRSLATVSPQGLNAKDSLEPAILPLVVPYSETAREWVVRAKQAWREHIRPAYHTELPFRLIPAFSKNDNLKDLLCKAKLPALGDSPREPDPEGAEDDLANLVSLALNL